MPKYELEELQEARRALDSTLGKCEKILPKLGERSSQQTLLERRIRAIRLAIGLIDSEIAEILKIKVN